MPIYSTQSREASSVLAPARTSWPQCSSHVSNLDPIAELLLPVWSRAHYRPLTGAWSTNEQSRRAGQSMPLESLCKGYRSRTGPSSRALSIYLPSHRRKHLVRPVGLRATILGARRHATLAIALADGASDCNCNSDVATLGCTDRPKPGRSDVWALSQIAVSNRVFPWTLFERSLTLFPS